MVARYTYVASSTASSTLTLTSPGSGEGPLNGKLTFVHTSYLGTPVLETDTKGDIVYIALTDINGNTILRDERNDSTLQNKLYTGHKYDNVTQLTYAHARYLDTRTHTFTSVDPLYYQLSSAQLYNPQLMNAYSYANNNPVVNTDPTGLFSWSAAAGFVTGALVSAAKSTASALTSIGNLTLGLVYNTKATVNNASVSVYNGVNAISNYISNNSAKTIVNNIANSISSTVSIASNQTVNANTYSQGYASGSNIIGTAVSTVLITLATAGMGTVANAVSKAGSIGDTIVTLNNASKAVNTVNDASTAVNDWVKISSTLRTVANTKGMYGLGEMTREEANVLGNAWVGAGAREMSGGGGLISSDGLKMYRYPKWKSKIGKTQANLEWKLEEGGETFSNGHIDIVD